MDAAGPPFLSTPTPLATTPGAVGAPAVAAAATVEDVRRSVLRTVGRVSLACACVYVLVSGLFPDGRLPRLLALAPGITLMALSQWVLSRGAVGAAAHLLMLAFHVMLGLGMAMDPTVSNPAFTGLLVEVAAAGLLLSGRGLVFWGAAAVGTAALVLWAGDQGLLFSIKEQSPGVLLSALAVYVVIVALMARMTVRQLDAMRAKVQVDLERRRRAEQDARDSREQLDLALDAAEEGIWQWSVQSGEVKASPQVARLVGCDISDPEQRARFVTWIHPEDRARMMVEVAAVKERQQRDFHVAYRLNIPGEPMRWLEWRGRTVRDAAGALTQMRGTVLNITQRMALEAELRQADRMRSLGLMSAGVAHEVNNPLTYVLANLDTAMEALARGGADAAREALPMLEDCRTGALRIREIAQDLRVFSRPEGAPSRAVRLDDTVASVLRLMRKDIEDAAVVVADLSGLPAVPANEARLAQVFTNLIRNAIQAMPPGRAARDNRVSIRGAASEHGVTITVEDNGSGVSAAVRERLFQPFMTTRGAGTGLGLSICRSIVESLGGTIRLEDADGAGARFVLTFPQARVHAAADGAQQPLSAVGAPCVVLAVDDDASVLEVVRRGLAPHVVHVAQGGAEALALLEGGLSVDVVLCDLMMPGLSGMDVAAAVQRRWPALAARMLFISGGAFTDAGREFVRDLPAGRLLNKPFLPQELHRAVQDVLEAARGGPA